MYKACRQCMYIGGKAEMHVHVYGIEHLRLLYVEARDFFWRQWP